MEMSEFQRCVSFDEVLIIYDKRVLNMLQKTQWAHVFISSRKGAREQLGFAFFWNNALEWESRFTLEMNGAKNTDCIEQCFKQKLAKIKFSPKNTMVASVIIYKITNFAEN